MEEVDDEEIPFLEKVQDIFLAPVRIFTAPSYRRIYVRGFIFICASAILGFLAVIAYTAFYFQFIPSLGFTLPIHLQFPDPELLPNPLQLQYPQQGASSAVIKYPFGIAQVPSGALTSKQAYDVRVHVCLPRTPENLQAGNFMLDVELRGEARLPPPPLRSVSNSGADKRTGSDGERTSAEDAAMAPVLAREARPAILTYVSPMVSRVATAALLPAYLLGFARETECLSKTIMDSVAFAKGWRNVPSTVRVEVRGRDQKSGEAMRLYGMSVEFAARFEGLRYLMYNHRIFSFVIFTTLFWLVELVAAMALWLSTSYLFSPVSPLRSPDSYLKPRDPIEAAIEAQTADAAKKGRGGRRIKTEGDEFDARSSEGLEDVGEEKDEDDADLSDTPRSFPTFSRQPPLRFESSKRPRTEPIKREEEEEDTKRLGAAGLSGTLRGEWVEEADDEDDEDADFVLDDPAALVQTGLLRTTGSAHDDSGLGTSMESSAQGGKDIKGSVRRRRKGE
ncbi:MAG: hypothetical protein M1831_002662 [Alyxoria varia]|nr:MAG: hypothetical protein M1831_002662 [Alyxoria varia]